MTSSEPTKVPLPRFKELIQQSLERRFGFEGTYGGGWKPFNHEHARLLEGGIPKESRTPENLIGSWENWSADYVRNFAFLKSEVTAWLGPTNDLVYVEVTPRPGREDKVDTATKAYVVPRQERYYVDDVFGEPTGGFGDSLKYQSPMVQIEPQSSGKVFSELEHNRKEAITGTRTLLDGSPDHRPVAVLAYAKALHNQSFGQEDLAGLMKGYRVLQADWSNEQELVSQLRTMTRDGQDPASLLILGGHPNQPSLNRWAALNPFGSSSDNLRPEDEAMLRGERVDRLVLRASQVVLFGSGAGGMANMLARVFPHSDIVATTRPMGGNIVLDDDQRFKRVDLPERELAKVDRSGALVGWTDSPEPVLWS